MASAPLPLLTPRGFENDESPYNTLPPRWRQRQAPHRRDTMNSALHSMHKEAFFDEYFPKAHDEQVASPTPLIMPMSHAEQLAWPVAGCDLPA